MVSKIKSIPLSSDHYPADLTSLQIILKKALWTAEKQNIDKKTIFRIRLSVEESVSNIIKYAYPGNPGKIFLEYFLRKGNIFGIRLKDSGIPFNLKDTHSPDTSSELGKRDIGGLGIYLIRKSTDKIHYHRKSQYNILTLEFYYL